MEPNLASEGNAKKINQRFKELETENVKQSQRITVVENSMGNMQNLINKQNDLIQKLWVRIHGNGPTEQ